MRQIPTSSSPAVLRQKKQGPSGRSHLRAAGRLECWAAEGSSKNPELHCIVVRKVDTGIPVKGAFGFIHQLLGIVLPSIPAGPAAQLFRFAATETDQLVPVLLKEVEDSGDDFFLSLDSIPRESRLTWIWSPQVEVWWLR